MRNVLAAFLLGVALTVGVFFMIRSPVDGPIVAGSIERAPPEISSAESAIPPAGVDQVATSSSPPVEAEVAAASADELANQVAPLSVPIPVTRPPTPLVLPNGTQIQTGASSGIHSELEHEPIDPGWASIAESELYGFFVENAVLSREFDYPSIQCRSTLCLIQVVTDDRRSTGAWRTEWLKLFREPWGGQFGTNPTAVQYYVTPENETAILWYLRKQVLDARTQSITGDASSAI